MAASKSCSKVSRSLCTTERTTSIVMCHSGRHEIDLKTKKTVMIKFDARKSSCGFEKAVNKYQILSELREDVKRGFLGLSLRMKISAFYWLLLLGLGTTVVLTLYCPPLNLEFVAARVEGKMVGGRNCSVPSLA